MICGGVYYGDRKINCLQALARWVTYLTLRRKIINLNNFKISIISGVIEELWLGFEDKKDGKGELSNPK